MVEPQHTSFDVAVVGGGVCGLVVAWRARERGLTVCLFDRGAFGAGATHVAAGMLAPVSEADAGERDLLMLGLQSARRWPSFADELGDLTGIDVGYRPSGALVVARDRDEAESLDRELALRQRMGLEVSQLLPSQARALEPALAPGIRAALEVASDHSADPRALVTALVAASRAAGAELRERTEVTRLLVAGDHVSGLEIGGGEQVVAANVVFAAGAWTDAIAGVPPSARVPVRPVKGQVIRLRDPAGPGLLDRVVRYDGGYVVPRGDGTYVLGATQEERGFDTSLTGLGIYELLRDAQEIVPGLLELEVTETQVGLRPATPDNAPVLGASRELGGLHWATGHHRNGILLAPMTGELLAAELAGEQAAPDAFSPRRFAQVAS